MKSILRIVLIAPLFLSLGTTSRAATVTLTLEFPQPGHFQVFAEASVGDNGGIVTIGTPILGDITSVNNVLPNAILAINAAGEVGPAGFTEVRSRDGNLLVTGAQQIVVPTPHIVYGFGQRAGSFAALGITPIGSPPEQPAWDAKLLVAEGTHTGRVDFDRRSVNLLADVFVAEGNPLPVKSAGLVLQNNTYTPEPYGIDVDLGQRQRFPFPLVTHSFRAIGESPITWSNLVHVGPSLGNSPSLSRTGSFQWNVTNAGLGIHTFDATVTNSFGSDVARLTITIVPEPAGAVLLSLAAMTLIASTRRGR